MKKQSKSVLVVFGGRSSEHDVSVITGVLTLNCIDKERYDPIPLYINDEGWFTGKNLFDLSGFGKGEPKAERVVILPGDTSLYRLAGGKLRRIADICCAVNCCHGLNGEDGSIAGFFRLAGIPLASPDILSSSVCMDKAAAKIFFKGLGIDVVEGVTLMKGEYFADPQATLARIEADIGYPVIVKPARFGSSIGIKRAADREGLGEAIAYAFRFDRKIVAERALENFTEINCAAYGSGGGVVLSECVAPSFQGELFTFEEKYISAVKRTKTPDFTDEETAEKVKNITALVYRSLGMTGVVRADFLLSGGRVYLNEVNTVPGSLALYMFRDKISAYGELIGELIREGMRAHREYEACAFTYPSCVLGSASALGGKSKAR